MILKRTTPANLFKIKTPIWGGRKVGLASHKVGMHNEIRIEQTNKEGELIYPQPLYISGENVQKYQATPLKKYPSVKLHIIPIEELEVLERE
jgi:hypothetical protein